MDMGKAMRSKVAEAVDKAPKLGLPRVDWDCAFGFGPHPNGQGLIGGYWIPLTTPSILLGQHVATMAMVPDVHADQATIDKAIEDAIDNLRSMKAKQAALTNGQGD